MPQFAVTRSPGIDFFYNALTSDTITQMTGGRIPKMTPEQASGLIGSWIVETGNPTLSNLDVVEQGAGAGRGLSQYTGPRRVAYDRARQQAIANGADPNSPQWQLQYFADEYVGKHDPAPGQSLSGYTRTFEQAPRRGTPEDYAQYYTGSASSGTGYFRPGVPHWAGRRNAAAQVYQLYGAGVPAQMTATAKPKPKKKPKSPSLFGHLNIPFMR